VAKYKKKRARELKHDKFRDTTLGLIDRVAPRLEGKGRQILYAIGGLIAVGLVAWVIMAWIGSRSDEARFALGRAIKITETPVIATPVAGSTAASFRTEKERAQKALEEFQKVAANYGGSVGEQARYFAATNQLIIDRAKGVSELEALTQSSDRDISALAKFAIAQVKEGDNKYDEAAALYSGILKEEGTIITPDSVNLRLAMAYQKLGKLSEAADILYKMVETARQAKGKDGKPIPQSSAVRKAEAELEKLDPDRHAKLPAPPLPSNLAM